MGSLWLRSERCSTLVMSMCLTSASELKVENLSPARHRELLDEGIAANDQLLERLEETLSRIQAFRDERVAAGARLHDSRRELELDRNGLALGLWCLRHPCPNHKGADALAGDSNEAPDRGPRTTHMQTESRACLGVVEITAGIKIGAIGCAFEKA